MKSILLAAALLSPLAASAHFPYSTGDCVKFSKVVGMQTSARDKGATYAQVQQATIALIKDVANGKGWIKDNNDAVMVLQAVDVVFNHMEDSPAKLSELARTECIKALVKQSK